jgi:porin
MGRLTSVIAAILLCIVGSASLKAQDHTPDYHGDLWSRATLTGDWGGLRTRLAEKGVTLNLDFLSIPQGVVSGGATRPPVRAARASWCLT